MAVTAVVARRLDRVTDGVTEVEDVAQAGVALVGGDDRALVAGAGEDDVVEVANAGTQVGLTDGLGDWTLPWDQWLAGSALAA